MRSKDPELMRKIENMVDSFYQEHRRAPSLRDIEQAVGISRQTASRYLREMDETGRLEYDGKGAIITSFVRELTTQQIENLDVIGCIAAGELTPAEEQIEGQIAFPSSLLGSGEHYALRVSGDSMVNARIADGDLVIIRKTQVADVGKIVAAVDDEGRTTLKRLAYDKAQQRYYLHPENPKYADIYPRELRIQGVAERVIGELN